MKRRDFLAKARAALLLPALPALAGNAERVPGISGDGPMMSSHVSTNWRDSSWALYYDLQEKDRKAYLRYVEEIKSLNYFS